MKVALILAALLAFLGMTLGWAVWAWEQTAGTEMSLHGWTAITLGIVFTILVGCGLMGLMFYSSRAGFDDEAGDSTTNVGGKKLPARSTPAPGP
jgi:hypothetical protein